MMGLTMDKYDLIYIAGYWVVFGLTWLGVFRRVGRQWAGKHLIFSFINIVALVLNFALVSDYTFESSLVYGLLFLSVIFLLSIYFVLSLVVFLYKRFVRASLTGVLFLLLVIAVPLYMSVAYFQDDFWFSLLLFAVSGLVFFLFTLAMLWCVSQVKKMLRLTEPEPGIKISRKGSEVTVTLKDDWMEAYQWFKETILWIWMFVDYWIFRLTKYFPFSLLHKNQVGHFQHTREYHTQQIINELSWKVGKPVSVEEIHIITGFTIYKCKMLTKRKVLWTEKFENRLMTELGNESIYFRNGSKPGTIEIIVPNLEEDSKDK